LSGTVLQQDRPAFAWMLLRGLLPPPAVMAYAVRTLLAVTLALYSAYALQLESPASAAGTVLIVANASRGALISKSVWRLFGSFLGVVAAVVLVAAFSQTPVLFVFGLAIWVGLCTFVSSAFRYNRSYASVLAGYTVALVAIPAIAAPERIFDLAIGRLSVVSIGVISAGLVFMLTDPGTGSTVLEPRLLALISGTSRLIADSFASDGLAAPRAARGSLAADIDSLDQVVEFTNAVETGFSRYAEDVRLAAAELFAVLTGGLRMSMTLHDLHHPDDRATARMVCRTLCDIGAAPPGTKAAQLAAMVAHARAELRIAMEKTQDLTALSGFDQALLLFGQLQEAIVTLASLEARKPRKTRLRLRGFVEWRTGRRNCLRAALAVSIGGLFWIVSQWPSGGNMLLIICVLSALLTQGPSAAAASIGFLEGIAATVVVAFIANFAILPRMTGFPLLLLGTLPFTLAGLLAQRVPRLAGAATAFLVLFLTTLAPGNPMVFDLAGALNGYVGLLAGGLFAVLTFRVLLPPNPMHEARDVADNLRRSTRRRPASATLVFENVEHQKLLRLAQRLQHRPDLRYEAVGEAVVSVLIGRHLETIRAAARDATLPAAWRAEAASAAGSARRTLCTDPRRLAAEYSAASVVLGLSARDLPQRRLAATLREVASLIDYDAAFLRREGVMAQ
jgi:uncharacterized membrane protein YccC